jgi:hypothetical protein
LGPWPSSMSRDNTAAGIPVGVAVFVKVAMGSSKRDVCGRAAEGATLSIFVLTVSRYVRRL